MSKEQEKRVKEASGSPEGFKDWGSCKQSGFENWGDFPTANEHRWDGEKKVEGKVECVVDICTQRHLPNSDPANETDDCSKDNYSYQDQPWDRGDEGHAGEYTYEDDKQEKDRGE